MGKPILHFFVILSSINWMPPAVSIDGFAEKVFLEDYPFLAAIEVSGRYRCPAAIIKEKYLLAPLRCLNDTKTGDVRIRTGTARRLEGGNLHQVATWHEFKPNDVHKSRCKVALHDITVIELERELIFGKTVNSTEIAHHCENVDDDVLVKVVGWGSPLDSECPNEVEAMTVPKMDMECCNDTYHGALRDGHFCAGFKDSRSQDSHLADLGDLMIHEDRLVGIVSYDTSCDEESKPIVYTDIGFYYNFITDIRRRQVEQQMERNELKD